MAFTAARALRGTREAGEPLPRVGALADLTRYGVEFRRGTVCMVAGRHGSQKSGFATWLASEWNLSTLYVSMDMDPHTATTRLGGLLSGRDSKEVGKIIALGDRPEDEADIFARLESSKIKFMFDSQPNLEDIEQEIAGLVEIYDDYPAVIIVDNLVDLEPLGDGGGGYQSDLGWLLEFKSLARATGALVLVLAHNKDEGDSNYPAPARGVMNKVSQPLAIQLSVALEAVKDATVLPFRIAPVKNRTGAGDPTGRTWFEIEAEPAITRFRARSVHPQDFYGQFTNG